MLSHHDIIDLMNTTDTWMCHDANHFTVYAKQENSESVYIEVPMCQLEEIHPDLPKSILALLQWQHETSGSASTLGYLVHHSYDCLTQKIVTFESSNQVGAPLSPVSYVQILKLEPEANAFKVEGYACTLLEMDYESEKVTIATHVDWHECLVSTAALEAAYPDWQTRWEVGHALDLEHDDLMDYLFTRGPSQEADISAISFS